MGYFETIILYPHGRASAKIKLRHGKLISIINPPTERRGLSRWLPQVTGSRDSKPRAGEPQVPLQQFKRTCLGNFSSKSRKLRTSTVSKVSEMTALAYFIHSCNILPTLMGSSANTLSKTKNPKVSL